MTKMLRRRDTTGRGRDHMLDRASCLFPLISSTSVDFVRDCQKVMRIARKIRRARPVRTSGRAKSPHKANRRAAVPETKHGRANGYSRQNGVSKTGIVREGCERRPPLRECSESLQRQASDHPQRLAYDLPHLISDLRHQVSPRTRS